MHVKQVRVSHVPDWFCSHAFRRSLDIFLPGFGDSPAEFLIRFPMPCIEAVIPSHLEMFIRDMPDEKEKEIQYALKVSIIKTAASIKEKVSFRYYRLAKGIIGE